MLISSLIAGVNADVHNFDKRLEIETRKRFKVRLVLSQLVLSQPIVVLHQQTSLHAGDSQLSARLPPP